MTAMYAPCLLLLMLVGTSGHFFRPPFMRRAMFPFRSPFFPGFRPGFHPGFHTGFNLGFHPGLRMGIPNFPITPSFARGSPIRPSNNLGITRGRRSDLARSLAETLIQRALSPSSIALSEAIGGNANAMSNVGGANLASTGWDQAQAMAVGNIANSISTANSNGITVVNPFGSDVATQDFATQALIANEVFDARPYPQTGMNTASKLSIQENVPKPIVTVTVQEPGTSGAGYTADTGAGYNGPGAPGAGHTAETGAGYTGSGAPGARYTVDNGAVYTGSRAPGAGYMAETGAGYTGPGASGAGHPAETGAGYTGSEAPGARYTVDNGAVYTGSRAPGAGNMAETGAGYTGPGASGAGYPAETGAGYTGSEAPGARYTVDNGAVYTGSRAPGAGYMAETGAGYIGPGASGAGYPAETGAGYTGSEAPGARYTVDNGAVYTGSRAPGAGYMAETGAGYTGPGASGAGYPAETGAGYTGSEAPGAVYTGSRAPGAGIMAETGAGYTGPGASGAGHPAETGAGYTRSGAPGARYTAETGAGYNGPGASGAGYTGSGTSGTGYATDVGANGGNTGLYDQAAAINSVLYLDAPSSPSSGAAVKADQGSLSNQLTGASPSSYSEDQQGPPTYLEMTGTTGSSGAADMRTMTNTIDQQYNQGVGQSSQGGQVTYETTVPQDNTQYGQVNMASPPVSTGNYQGDFTAKATGSKTYDVQAAGKAGGAQGGILSLNDVMGGQQQAPPQGAPLGDMMSRIEAQSGIGSLGGPMYETGMQTAGDMGQLQNGYDLGVGNIPMSSAMQGGEQASLGMMSQAGQPLFDGNQGGPMYETRGSGGAYSPDMLPSLHSENQPLMGYNGMAKLKATESTHHRPSQGFEQMSALPGTTVSKQSGRNSRTRKRSMGTSVLTVTKGLPMAGDFPQNAVTGESMNTPSYMKTRSMTVTV